MLLISLAYAVTVPSFSGPTEVTSGSSTYACRLANVGDVNADGYDELAVSDCTQGRVYVYFGSASGVSSGSVVTLSGPLGSRFGWSIADDGDLNADGYADIVIGAPSAAGGRGCAYIFHGGASISPTATALRCGSRTTERQGGNVTIAPDLNGDGYDDLVVAPEYGGNGLLRVYRGSAAGAVTTAQANRALAGYTGDVGESLRGAGDVNGDGYGDVILGAPYYNGENGSFRVYYGAATPSLASYTQLDAPTGYLNNLGMSVAAAGDVDLDGYDDVIVGGPGLEQFEVYGWGAMNGQASLFYGGSSGLDTTREDLVTTDSGDDPYAPTMGYSVSGAGDLNGDGYPDLAASTLNAGSYSGTRWGNVTVSFTEGEYLPWDSSPTPYTVVWGDLDGPMGMSISVTGDYNGDGCDDIATTMGNASAGDGSHAEVYTPSCCIYSGPPESSPC